MTAVARVACLGMEAQRSYATDCFVQGRDDLFSELMALLPVLESDG